MMVRLYERGHPEDDMTCVMSDHPTFCHEYALLCKLSYFIAQSRLSAVFHLFWQQ